MRALAWLVGFVLLAGCGSPSDPGADVQDAPAPTNGEPDVQPDPESNGTDVNDEVPEPVVENHAPVVHLEADVSQARVPFAVRLDFNATDADNDTLTWNLTFNGEQVANGTRVPANHTLTITSGGNHSVVLLVSDGINATSQDLIIQGTTPLAFDVTDATGDGIAPTTDAVRFEGWVEEGRVRFVVTVASLHPGADADGAWPWKYNVYVGAHKFQNFNFIGPQTWDTTNGEYIQGTSWDPDAGTISISITEERLAGLGLTAPYEVYLQTAVGHLSLLPDHGLDRVPGSGTLVVG